ncbi:ATP-binding response regulator [Reinekea thalattae]|uniref:histidine kinase n=1 Tax=Reinekea thalattae TaxID=2593301 RepID=A0A5C8Z997_9GAMM|nr:hybrid sensor histidine kinase/response regulator [Reinekea thalattae]TXR54512.1 hybrid sensor histidine kinase/response regulator [Reinekea thalattae]
MAADIKLERHRLFMSEVGSRMLSTAVGALFVGAIFYQSASFKTLMIWFLAVLFVSFNSWFIISRHNLQAISTKSILNLSMAVQYWHWVNLYLALTWGLLWAATPFLFFPDASQVQMLCVLMLIVVIASTPSVTMGSYPDVYVLFLTPVFFSFGWHLWGADFDSEWLPRIIAPVTWASLVVFSLIIHRTQIESIILRLEHRDSEKLAVQRNQAKTRFVAVASHDLRQPIQAARLYAETMQKNPQLRTNQTVNNLADSLHSAGLLLDRLLDLSKMDAGVIKVEKRIQPIGELLSRVASIHRIQAEEKLLKFHYSSDRVWAEIDEHLVGEILDNLLANAIRYTPSGSVWLKASSRNGYVEIQVRDTGVGMTSAELKLAFEEFSQLGDSDKDLQQGMGLGLPIVERLCNLHEIDIHVTSEPNKGTCFTLRLDAASKPVTDLQQYLAYAKPSSYRILLVEDEEAVADAISLLLVAEGHDVGICKDLSGTEVIMQSNWHPDILLTDDRLPNAKNSQDIINEVSKKHPNIPVIVITGNTSPERLKVLKEGNLRVLFKPVSGNELLEEIEAMLQVVDKP